MEFKLFWLEQFLRFLKTFHSPFPMCWLDFTALEGSPTRTKNMLKKMLGLSTESNLLMNANLQYVRVSRGWFFCALFVSSFSSQVVEECWKPDCKNRAVLHYMSQSGGDQKVDFQAFGRLQASPFSGFPNVPNCLKHSKKIPKPFSKHIILENWNL